MIDFVTQIEGWEVERGERQESYQCTQQEIMGLMLIKSYSGLKMLNRLQPIWLLKLPRLYIHENFQFHVLYCVVCVQQLSSLLLLWSALSLVPTLAGQKLEAMAPFGVFHNFQGAVRGYRKSRKWMRRMAD